MNGLQVPDFGVLFRGSARLGALVAGLGIPWIHTRAFITAFADELNRYQELSVDGDGQAIGVMTRGCTRDFGLRVARFLDVAGCGEREVRRFLVRARYFEYRDILFKVEIDETGMREFSYYVHTRPRLPVARAWLADCGVDDAAWSRVAACAAALDKRTTHFLACSIDSGQPSLQKVYFSQPIDDGVWTRIDAAARAWDGREQCFEVLAEHRELLARESLFVSVSFRGPEPVAGLKLDARCVPPELVASMLPGRPSTLERFELLRHLFGKERYDYVGLRPEQSTRLAARAYCYDDQRASSRIPASAPEARSSRESSE